MSHNARAPSGMLNVFVYESRTPYESIKKKRTNIQDSITLKQLDREMRALTDAGILKKARIKQKSFDIGRGKAVMV